MSQQNRTSVSIRNNYDSLTKTACCSKNSIAVAPAPFLALVWTRTDVEHVTEIPVFVVLMSSWEIALCLK